MKKHYEWFCRSQAGNLENYQLPSSDFDRGYRWRGRTLQHILTSGLDDYPRAQPTASRGVCTWMLSAGLGSMAVGLRKISAFLREKDDQENVSRSMRLTFLQSIEGIHWSETDQAYCDTTLIDGDRVERVCHRGYISLFPFLVGLMGPDHLHLEAVLDLIRNPEELWSHHGIRSLSLKDKYYGTGENYWRSPIWININYMLVQRLLVTMLRSCPFFFRPKDIIAYSRIRNSLSSQAHVSKRRGRYTWSFG